MLINVLCVCRLSAESFDYYYYGPRHYDGDFLRALDFCEIGFKNQMEVLENHKAQIVFEDDILAETQNFKIYNYGGDIDDGTLVMYFDGQLLPLGHTYTLRLVAGSISHLVDNSIVNEELSFPLVVPANLNHYFRHDWSEIRILEEPPKTLIGYEVYLSTEVESIGSPIVYLKRNGETIGEYPAEIRTQDWDFSNVVVNFPAVTLEERAEYTLVLPANSCCSQYRADLTNDEITFMIQEASSAVCEVEQSSDDNAPIYDLMGRRVLNPTKGIYIKSGKKILINR